MKITKTIRRIFLIFAGIFAPFTALALDWSTYTQIVISIETLIDTAFGVLLALAVFVVAWGIFKFIVQASSEQARAQGRAFILWGIFRIFIMVSIWGLVNLLSSTIELDNRPGMVPIILPSWTP